MKDKWVFTRWTKGKDILGTSIHKSTKVWKKPGVFHEQHLFFHSWSIGLLGYAR